MTPIKKTMNLALWIFTGCALVISFIKNKKKTISALKAAYKKFVYILSLFLIIMAGYAVVITFLPPDMMQDYIGAESGLNGIILSLSLGSVSVMPGFAAFPLCAALKSEGIPLYILAAFSISLMNVGVVTFPIEKKYLGVKVAIIRNIIALFISILAVIAFKLVFNE
jgi:uncharacterized membrane protein YraQ (UPF0718 family)